MPHRNVLLLPLSLSDEVIHDTHTSLLSGHEGISRTKERLLQNYFWPNMEVKISQHVAACLRCQARRTTDKPKLPLLTSMPQCTSLNQRVACDLMGPLRTCSQGKHYVLCLTDAFTKYAEITAVTDKSAPTVARAIFEKWICRFGCPVEITSDNGKEFCNELTKELFKLLQIKHATTTPYHPQCNSQANNIPLSPPTALINKKNPLMFHQSVAFGPSYVSDKLGLPIVRHPHFEPLWVTNCRKFLKKLSVSKQNR
jgi:transposase InsO family protein